MILVINLVLRVIKFFKQVFFDKLNIKFKKIKKIFLK